MKKELKVVCGTILAIAAVMSASRVNADISIGMEPVAYSVRPAAWGQVSRPSSTDRLSAAAESLAEAAGSGDNAKVETLLAGLYSGAAGKEAAAPVYTAKAQAAPVPAAPAPAPVKRAAAVKSAIEDLEVAAGDSVSVEALAPAPEVSQAVSGKGSAEAEEEPEETLLQTLLGGGIGMLLVILLILLL